MSHVGTSLRALTVSTTRRGDAAVLTLSGGLDATRPVESGHSVEAALRSVEGALAAGPRVVVVDLSGVVLTRFLVGVLGLFRRRTARTGVPLVLAGLSAAATAVDHAPVAGLYRSYPSVPAALRACTVGAVPA